MGMSLCSWNWLRYDDRGRNPSSTLKSGFCLSIGGKWGRLRGDGWEGNPLADLLP